MDWYSTIENTSHTEIKAKSFSPHSKWTGIQRTRKFIRIERNICVLVLIVNGLVLNPSERKEILFETLKVLVLIVNGLVFKKFKNWQGKATVIKLEF